MFFSNKLSSVPSETIARLNGVPGSVITYTASNERTGVRDHGSGTVTVNGIETLVRGLTSSNKTVTIPSTGYVSCSVQQTNVEYEGTTWLTIISTSQGTLSSSKTLYDYDVIPEGGEFPMEY